MFCCRTPNRPRKRPCQGRSVLRSGTQRSHTSRRKLKASDMTAHTSILRSRVRDSHSVGVHSQVSRARVLPAFIAEFFMSMIEFGMLGSTTILNLSFERMARTRRYFRLYAFDSAKLPRRNCIFGSVSVISAGAALAGKITRRPAIGYILDVVVAILIHCDLHHRLLQPLQRLRRLWSNRNLRRTTGNMLVKVTRRGSLPSKPRSSDARRRPRRRHARSPAAPQGANA